MIEKINPDLLASNKKYYERELSRPRFGFYDKVKGIDSSASSLETAAFCDSIENFLATYKTIAETLEGNSYLDGKLDKRRTFINLFATYASAASSLSRLKKLGGKRKEEKNFSFQADYTQGSYSFVDQLLTPFIGYISRIKDSEELIDFASSYFESVLKETENDAKNPEYENLVQQISELQLQVNGITLNGFNYTSFTPKSYSFSTSLEDIVGNQEMISTLKRGIHNLLKYDSKTKQNIMLTEFDGFQRTFTFYGQPGTGKTITIEAMLNYATKLSHKVSKSLVIENITNSFKSEYYSKSIQNLKEVFDRIKDGNESYLVILEDIDTILFSRDELKNRPEDKAILGTIMNYLEGIEAPKIGNDLIIVTTNNPELIDNALFSRLSESIVHVPGPQTQEDYEKLFKIKLRKSIANNLVDLTKQEWQQVGKQCIQEEFTGRDIKNLSKGILSKIYDVNEPEEVLSLNPEHQKQALLQVYSKADFNLISNEIEKYSEQKNVR